MGYRIAYSTETSHKFPARTNRKKPMLWALTGALLVGLLAGGWKLLLPGDPETTHAALTHLVEDIRAGESMGQAVTAFCQEIVENAK